jgi:hypothetical protein
VKTARIIRSDGTIVHIDMKKLLSGCVAPQGECKDYVLYPGDTMVVPESRKFNWGLISTILGIIMVSLQITYIGIQLAR